MALSQSSLKSKIETQLQNAGFVLTGEHSRASAMAQAIATAVVDEITSNAQVIVAGGSSSGTYQVK